jgi:hypothetical protein
MLFKNSYKSVIVERGGNELISKRFINNLGIMQKLPVFLLGKSDTTSAMPSVLFALVILEIGSHILPRLAWTAILLFCVPHHSCDDRHMLPCPAFCSH